MQTNGDGCGERMKGMNRRHGRAKVLNDDDDDDRVYQDGRSDVGRVFMAIGVNQPTILSSFDTA
jgi:predicted pyridoxine 5'-phosphate oxidase superfamily flavin-nucleotide-binding protein